MEECPNPMDLFDSWARQGGRRERSAEYYRRLDFVEEFIAYTASLYVGRGSTAVDVMWRFYSALMSVGYNPMAPTGDDDRGQAANAVVRLSRDVRIVSVRGDVVKVLGCLKKKRKPGLECRDRVTTVSVRKTRYGRSEIEQLPPLAAAILGCLDGSADEIVRKLAARGMKWGDRAPAQFVPEALRILERDGVVSCPATG
jgi:hypothetical protein